MKFTKNLNESNFPNKLIINESVYRLLLENFPSDYRREPKERRPKKYKRSHEKIDDESQYNSPFLRADKKSYPETLRKKYNLYPTPEHVDAWNANRHRGERLVAPNSLQSYDSRYIYNDSEEPKTDFSARVYNNYSNAIRRHSDYNFPIYTYMDDGHSIMYKPFKNDDSCVIGRIKGNDIFIITHFAPSSLRKGYELIQKLSDSKMPVVFAVPDYLSNQLTKSGFRQIGTIPQIFAGEIVSKNVMINNAVTDEDLETLYSQFRNESKKINKIIITEAQFKRLIFEDKKTQLAIINSTNPMHDSYHTGIRTEEDIRTFDEILKDDFVYPDYTEKDAYECKLTGKIIIYSSHPIMPGTFVTPSKMNAKDYAGSGKIYSKLTNIDSVAWITPDEGQYIG